MSRNLVVVLSIALACLATPAARAQSRPTAAPPASADPRAQIPTDPREMQTPQTTIADTVPPPPGAPNLAWLASLEFDPPLADSLGRAFMAAFRGAFAEGAYATERERDGRPAASVPVSARFRLIEGTGGWGAWNVQIVLNVVSSGPSQPPGYRITVAALSPQAVEAGARPIPARAGFSIEPGEPAGPGDGRSAMRRTPSESWRIVGRTAGLLALEHLHHLSGDLDENARFALGPVRREAPGPVAAPPVGPQRR